MSGDVIRIYNDMSFPLYILMKKEPYKYVIVPSQLSVILGSMSSQEKVSLDDYEFKIWDSTSFQEVDMIEKIVQLDLESFIPVFPEKFVSYRRFSI